MSDALMTTEEDWGEGDKSFATRFGIWLFLSTEVLFFGGFFCAYAVFRHLNPVGFGIGGEETEILFGSLNTVVLATSACTMTVALKAGDIEAWDTVKRFLAFTFALGVCFVILKGLEYWGDLRDHLMPGHHFRLKNDAAAMFWGFYWLLTGLHAIHLTIGLGIVARLYLMLHKDMDVEAFRRNLDVGSLYWHLVDAIWFVIYPTLYLCGRSG